MTSGRGRGRFYKIFVQESITTKCSVHHKNHPANVKIFFSIFLGLIWKGAPWILQNACPRGVPLQNTMRITKTIQQTYFFLNFWVYVIWRGAWWVLQNACAGVYQYKMQCAWQSSSRKPGSPASNLCSVSEKDSEHGFFEFAWDLTSGEQEHESI